MKALAFTLSLIGILLIITAVFMFGGTPIESIPVSDNQADTSNIIQASPEGTSLENAEESPTSDPELSPGNTESSKSSEAIGESTSQNCEIVQISYSLANFLESQECINLVDGICLEKKLKCSADLANLDETISGTFEFNLEFNDKITGKEIQSVSKINELSPKQTIRLETETTINSEGVNGDANKEIKCKVAPMSIPTKEVCS